MKRNFKYKKRKTRTPKEEMVQELINKLESDTR